MVQLYKIIVYIIVLQIQNEFLLAEISFGRKCSTFLRRTKFCESLNGFSIYQNKQQHTVHLYIQNSQFDTKHFYFVILSQFIKRVLVVFYCQIFLQQCC